MERTIIVKYQNEKLGTETYHDAEVAIAQPGLFVIQNAQGQRIAMFPIGYVASVQFPDGPNRIEGVTL